MVIRRYELYSLHDIWEQEENDNAFKAIKGSEWSDGEPLLKALRNRIKELELDFFESGLKINPFEAKLTGQMLCGSGIDHIKDVGMSLIFPYGIPYIPGSSIKGVLR